MKSKVHEAYWRIIMSEVYEEEAIELIAFVDMMDHGLTPNLDTVNKTCESVLDSLKNTKYLDDAKVIVSDIRSTLVQHLDLRGTME